MKHYKFTAYFSGLQEKKFEWIEEAECLTEAFANAMNRKGINLNDAREVTVLEMK